MKRLLASWLCGALLALWSCAGAPDKGSSPSPGAAVISGSQGSESPAAPECAIVRCYYSIEGVERHLDVGPVALGISADLLRRLLAPPPTGPSAPNLPVARSWDILPGDSGEILHVEDRGGDTLWLPLAGGAGAVEASFPELLTLLRRSAAEALTRSMSAPRTPLDWQSSALLELWSLPSLEVPLTGAQILSLVERARDPAPLVRRLLPRLDALLALEGADLALFAADAAVERRILHLAADARRGSRPSLVELPRLALEYFGESPLFAAGLRAAIPAALNPGLYRRFPVVGAPSHAIAFLKEVEARLGAAVFEEGKGWRLEEPPS